VAESFYILTSNLQGLLYYFVFVIVIVGVAILGGPCDILLKFVSLHQMCSSMEKWVSGLLTQDLTLDPITCSVKSCVHWPLSKDVGIHTSKEIYVRAGHLWLTPVILATQEAGIRRILVGSQLRQRVCEALF
jgi:hypothetical protein